MVEVNMFADFVQAWGRAITALIAGRCEARIVRLRDAVSGVGQSPAAWHIANIVFTPPMDPQNVDLKQTVNLPKTGFSMKANLPQAEPKMLTRWEKERLYQQDSRVARRPAHVRAARRAAVCQRPDSPGHRVQQDPEGLRGEVEDHGGLRLAVRAGLGLPRAADRNQGR